MQQVRRVHCKPGTHCNTLCLVYLSVVLLLLLMLLLLAARRHRQQHDCYAAVDNPDDDVRENIIHYDEEGVGMYISASPSSSSSASVTSLGLWLRRVAECYTVISHNQSTYVLEFSHARIQLVQTLISAFLPDAPTLMCISSNSRQERRHY